MVGLLSSAARIPFCFATMACATDLSSSIFMGSYPPVKIENLITREPEKVPINSAEYVAVQSAYSLGRTPKKPICHTMSKATMTPAIKTKYGHTGFFSAYGSDSERRDPSGR